MRIKTYKLFCLLGILCSMAFALNSCSSDDDNDNKEPSINSIIGDWYSTKNYSYDGNETIRIYRVSFTEEGRYYTFLKTGNSWMPDRYFRRNSDSGTFSLVGDIIYLPSDDTVHKALHIKELTSNTLKLEYYDGEEYVLSRQQP